MIPMAEEWVIFAQDRAVVAVTLLVGLEKFHVVQRCLVFVEGIPECPGFVECCIDVGEVPVVVECLVVAVEEILVDVECSAVVGEGPVVM